jgi:hypothetical protein
MTPSSRKYSLPHILAILQNAEMLKVVVAQLTIAFMIMDDGQQASQVTFAAMIQIALLKTT